MKIEILKSSGVDSLLQKEIKTQRKLHYSKEDVMKSACEYFSGDELAAKVWIDKYALKDFNGRLLEHTPDDMHRRLSLEIAKCEQRHPNPMQVHEIYNLIKGFRYLVPQGGAMSGIGNNYQFNSLSNCFVVGPDGNRDSYGSILRVDEEQIQLMKRRGGVGHDLSDIRPKGSPVLNSAIKTAGIVPFMERYSNSTQEVAQDGRRGALMLSLSVKHPDILDFITAKQNLDKVTGANISVKLDDDFMKAVESDSVYQLKFPTNTKSPTIIKKVQARKIWDQLIHSAWLSAEPGVLFWDTIKSESIPDCYASEGFATVSTNPCGEIPLCPYDSCRLLAINLFSYVVHPFTKNAKFDFDLFKEHAAKAVRVMDDIVDLEIEKIDRIISKIKSDPQETEVKIVELSLWKKIRKKCINGRRIGIGITAEGDMLAALNLKYGCKEAIHHSVTVHQALALSAYHQSVQLAKERGSFPIYNHKNEINNPFIIRLKAADPALYAEMCRYGRRNIALLTIAPTGTTSLMTQTSSGIEPAFRVSYTRRRKVQHEVQISNQSNSSLTECWEEHRVFHHKFLKCLQQLGYTQEAISSFSENEIDELVKLTPYYRSEAKDINWINKVSMQGAIQKWVDQSISVTVNLPEETTKDLIHQIYLKAWKSGCKGMTVYREGSRSGVLISKSSTKNESPQYTSKSFSNKRPKVLPAKIFRFRNYQEKWIAAIGLLNDKPYEIFTGEAKGSFDIPDEISAGWIVKNKNVSGQSSYDFQYTEDDGTKTTFQGLSECFNPEFWNLAKLISGVLRHGMPVKYLVKVVSNLSLDDASLNTWKNGVIRALSKFIVEGTICDGAECPSCSESKLIYQEGCLMCPTCSFTKCG